MIDRLRRWAWNRATPQQRARQYSLVIANVARAKPTVEFRVIEDALRQILARDGRVLPPRIW